VDSPWYSRSVGASFDACDGVCTYCNGCESTTFKDAAAPQARYIFSTNYGASPGKGHRGGTVGGGIREIPSSASRTARVFARPRVRAVPELPRNLRQGHALAAGAGAA